MNTEELARAAKLHGEIAKLTEMGEHLSDDQHYTRLRVGLHQGYNGNGCQITFDKNDATQILATMIATRQDELRSLGITFPGDELVRGSVPNSVEVKYVEPDTVWGDPIPVDGVRPEWLNGDDQVMDVDLENRSTNGTVRPAARWGWTLMKSIRLPATHHAYEALNRGFVPWSGGDEAPSDWDGGEVLTYDATAWGDKYQVKTKSGNTRPCWQRDNHYTDIIGYRKRKTTEPAQPETQSEYAFGPWVDVKPGDNPFPIGSQYQDVALDDAIIDNTSLTYARHATIRRAYRIGEWYDHDGSDFACPFEGGTKFDWVSKEDVTDRVRSERFANEDTTWHNVKRFRPTAAAPQKTNEGNQ